jgi:hypothetical protein
MLKRSAFILGVLALLVLPAAASAHARPHHHGAPHRHHRARPADTDTPAMNVVVIEEHITTPAEEAENADLLSQAPTEPVTRLEEETPADPEA